MRGILAAFETEQALRQALATLRQHAMVGFCGFFFLLTWVNVWNWPLDIGGRPPFSWPVFVPITFELGILSAVTAGFIGYFAINRMPRPYAPIDHCESMRRAMRDLWIVAVESEDRSRLVQTSRLLAGHAPLRIEEIPEE